MITVVLVVLGLVLGSFVNALVWRLHEQSKKGVKQPKKLSVVNGRSMCPTCRHELKALDLVPVFSWLALRGRCRYCKKPVSAQYPLVELVTAGLFVGSYWFWPASMVAGGMNCSALNLFQGATWNSEVLFIVWLGLLVGLLALFIYDLRWFLLPNRIIYPLTGLATVYAALNVLASPQQLKALIYEVLAVIVGGGLFYAVFQLSKGAWIGGGDVKLGALLGLIVGTPSKAVLFIFIASVLGSLISLPLLAVGKFKRNTTIPFGPLLITGAVIAVLFGDHIIDWYKHLFIGF